MERDQQLLVVEGAVREWGDAVFDNRQQPILQHHTKRIEHLLNEFFVHPEEFKGIVAKLHEETQGEFPSVIILEVVFPKVPVLDNMEDMLIPSDVMMN